MKRCQLHKVFRLLDISKPNGECQRKEKIPSVSGISLNISIRLTIEFLEV